MVRGWRCLLCALQFLEKLGVERLRGNRFGMRLSQRLYTNVQGAFKIKRSTRLDGMRVLLVDDVVTTGATAAACARALKRAGAKHVTVLALARTDRRLFVDPYPASAAQTMEHATGSIAS